MDAGQEAECLDHRHSPWKAALTLNSGEIMNRFKYIVAGFLFTLFTSFVGLVLLPILTVGNQTPLIDPETGEQIPPSLTALELRGKGVYMSNGCMYCHSQQVRPERVGTDIARGWGKRRTIAADYMNEGRTLLGTMRTGPDLATIGIRMPAESWHLLHLYNPQTTSKGSNMPPFPFLFDKRKIGEQKSPEALPLSGEYAPEDGYEIIPTDEVKALVAYLQSLKLGHYDVKGAQRAVIESKAEIRKK
ncbi:MAG: cytochrome c oxidase cbb3-type subunit 2 [Akkermansiaceae bacterium]